MRVFLEINRCFAWTIYAAESANFHDMATCRPIGRRAVNLCGNNHAWITRPCNVWLQTKINRPFPGIRPASVHWLCSCTARRRRRRKCGRNVPSGLTHRSVSIDPSAQPVGSRLCGNERERDGLFATTAAATTVKRTPPACTLIRVHTHDGV